MFYICRLERKHGIPEAVALVQKKCQKPDNVLPVQRKPFFSPLAKKPYVVCVTPLNLHFNDYHKLVEFIEVNRVFGASGFTFYNQNSSALVQEVLNSYVMGGLVDVINWTVPVHVDTWPPSSVVEVHYFAQAAALNDCLYRNRHFYKYGVFIDLDEIIVPHKHTTWTELIQAVPARSPQNLTIASYIFRNTFFFANWPDDEDASRDQNIRKSKITTLLKVQRENRIYPGFSRSKYIVDLDKAVVVLAHYVDEFVHGAVSQTISPELGLLHHYRATMEIRPQKAVKDTTMHRFKQEIIRRISSRLAKLDPIIMPRDTL